MSTYYFKKRSSTKPLKGVLDCFSSCLYWGRQKSSSCELKIPECVAKQTDRLRSLSPVVKFPHRANSTVESSRHWLGALCTWLPLGLFSYHNWILFFSKGCRSLHWYGKLPPPPPPHCPKSVRIFVFLCKQQCGVNNTSGSSLLRPVAGLWTFWLSSGLIIVYDRK